METLPDRINRRVFLLTLKPDRSTLLGVFSSGARALVTDLGSPSAGMRICQLLGSLVGGSLEGLIPLCSLRKARFMDLKTEVFRPCNKCFSLQFKFPNNVTSVIFF